MVKAHTTGMPLKNLLLGASCLALTSFSTPAYAVEFGTDDGSVTGTIDTTVSVGATFRVSDRNGDNYGRSNGGGGNSINVDDGNLNYDTGLAALAARVTHEGGVDYKNFGAFGRVSYFYDLINHDKESTRAARTNFTRLSSEAIEAVGSDIELLDAYVYGNFDIEEKPLDVRIGNQVLSWGESTFIQNGINAINPIEVSAIRVPGSELKNALKPVPMISANFGATENLSIEGFYQFEWEQTEPEAAGTLFSTNDFASPGGSEIYLGFGDPLVPQNGTSVVTPITPLGSRVTRAGDRSPDDLGQFGIAARYFSEEANNTEFGFYYLNHHSRLPVISARTGSATDLAGITADNFADGSNYFLDYREDVQILGASFNTSVAGGIALQGEVSHRIDQPIQIDDVEILQAALAGGSVSATCNPAFGGSAGAACDAVVGLFNTNQVIQDLGGISAANAGEFFDREIAGFKEHNVTQGQMTMTKVNDPMLGSDQWVFVGELGFTYIHNMPSTNELRYEVSGTSVGGNGSFIGVGGMPSALPGSAFATDLSTGYRLRARFDYLNVWDGINLYPSISWSHDLTGNTPAPLSNFQAGRKAIGLGIEAVYLDNLSASVNYTNFFGGDETNLLSDRDFISMNIKYSF